ncbi:DUF3515 domain-containing protein [Nocardioides sp. SYSU D00038]|uniref:DUF3515 domain-containing protein n=1 Tax=Nocardioides sp. SYSU D00038 TaxID=2812554 RepID=UPI001967E0A0|nr:DUF3515 domain-containing protein [Nocardioides sp. SYSU D00038]
MSLRTRGVVACAALSVAALTGCGNDTGPVDVPAEELSPDDATACAALVDALPDELAGAASRPVRPDQRRTAAWGDPVVVLSCGVPFPDVQDPFASCVEANGVDWYVPPEQDADNEADLSLYVVGYQPTVRLDVPGERRPEGASAAIAELAGPVRETLAQSEPCN